MLRLIGRRVHLLHVQDLNRGLTELWLVLVGSLANGSDEAAGQLILGCHGCCCCCFLDHKSEHTVDMTFVTWLSEKGALCIHRLALEEFAETGRGLMATQDLAVDELILEMPRSLVITAQDCKQRFYHRTLYG